MWTYLTPYLSTHNPVFLDHLVHSEILYRDAKQSSIFTLSGISKLLYKHDKWLVVPIWTKQSRSHNYGLKYGVS